MISVISLSEIVHEGIVQKGKYIIQSLTLHVDDIHKMQRNGGTVRTHKLIMWEWEYLNMNNAEETEMPTAVYFVTWNSLELTRRWQQIQNCYKYK